MSKSLIKGEDHTGTLYVPSGLVASVDFLTGSQAWRKNMIKRLRYTKLRIRDILVNFLAAELDACVIARNLAHDKLVDGKV